MTCSIGQPIFPAPIFSVKITEFVVLVVFKLSRLQSSFALIQTTGNSSSITHAEADWFPIKELNLEVS